MSRQYHKPYPPPFITLTKRFINITLRIPYKETSYKIAYMP